MDDRYSRNEGLFGADGQRKLGRCRVGLAGAGGLGFPVAQQLAYLGVRDVRLVDDDVVELHSLNRLVGARPTDVGRKKIDVITEMMIAIAPDTRPVRIPKPLEHPLARAALCDVDVIFGCLDRDLARLHLLELATTAGVPLFDLASDVVAEPNGDAIFGGRVLFSGEGKRCAFCMQELDQAEIRRATMTGAELDAEARTYGVPVDALAPSTGPSVVSVNGVIASLAVTEFMKLVTGLGTPAPLLRYIGNTGVVRRAFDAPAISPCPYCARWGSARRERLSA